jgi:DNA replication protein DnaC
MTSSPFTVEAHPNLVGALELPAQFTDVHLDTIPYPKLKEQVREYGRQFWDLAPRGIAPVWLGPPATYKSYSAAVLCTAMHAQGVKTAWLTVPVKLTELERKRYSDAAEQALAHWKRVPFLVLDDFAMVRLNSWQHDALVEIAMARFESQRPTLWTGNVFLEPGTTPKLGTLLDQVVGVQLTRRILERSEGFRYYVGRQG